MERARAAWPTPLVLRSDNHHTVGVLAAGMRVKVECGPPLPVVKAWFIVPPVSTVSDLKDTLCSELPALSNVQTLANDIALYLDGFELLDATPIDVVRDGDLIT